MLTLCGRLEHYCRYIRFGNPYSPHQLGTYPIADSPTIAQEPMPLENTGNMFFMMLGIIQNQNRYHYIFCVPQYDDEVARVVTPTFTFAFAAPTCLGSIRNIGPCWHGGPMKSSPPPNFQQSSCVPTTSRENSRTTQILGCAATSLLEAQLS